MLTFLISFTTVSFLINKTLETLKTSKQLST